MVHDATPRQGVQSAGCRLETGPVAADSDMSAENSRGHFCMARIDHGPKCLSLSLGGE